MKAEDYIREQLANGPKLFRDLAQGTKLSERTLQAAARRLEVTRTRDGEGGPWRWALPEESHLFAPPAHRLETPERPPVIDAEIVEPASPTTRPIPRIGILIPLPPPIDLRDFLALAEERGLNYPLCVSFRSVAPPAKCKRHMRIYSAPGTISEIILNDYDPGDELAPYMAVSLWLESIRRPQPPSIVFENGLLSLVTNTTRRNW